MNYRPKLKIYRAHTRNKSVKYGKESQNLIKKSWRNNVKS